MSEADEFPKPVETIIVVHGTFSNPAESTESAWWSPGSLFCSKLDGALELQGLPARCWKHVDLQYSRPMTLMGITLFGLRSSVSPFSWSGKNLESERRLAAESLQQYLTDIEGDPRVGRYYLIAHSHGGNVVTRAMRDIKTPPTKFGAAIFLGTPFLGFDDEGRIRNILRRINWPIIMLITVLSLLSAVFRDILYDAVRALYHLGMYPIYSVLLLVVGSLSSILYMFVTYYEQTWSPMRHVPGMMNIVFPDDEAIGLLKKCAAVALEPHLPLHELFKDSPLTKAGRREFLLSSISRIKLVGKILEAFTMLCFVVLYRPYRPHFRLFFGSRLRGFRQSFFYFKKNPQVFDTVQPVGSVVVPNLLAACYLIFLPIDLTFGAIDWLMHVASRMSIWLAVRSAANAAFGIDILGSAFHWNRVAKTPEHITTLMLSPEAQERALAEIGSLDRLRSPVVQALQSSDMIATVDAVKRALQGTDLLHSRYYKDDYVVRYIAELLGAVCAAQRV